MGEWQRYLKGEKKENFGKTAQQPTSKNKQQQKNTQEFHFVATTISTYLNLSSRNIEGQVDEPSLQSPKKHRGVVDKAA